MTTRLERRAARRLAGRAVWAVFRWTVLLALADLVARIPGSQAIRWTGRLRFRAGKAHDRALVAWANAIALDPTLRRRAARAR